MKKFFTKLICITFIFLIFPLQIYADDYIEEDSFDIEQFDSIETLSSNEAPAINARYAVVLDRSSKQILYAKSENEKCKMASTTKIMTAIVVLENSDINDIVTISSKAASIQGSRLGLSKNDKITIKDLLYGLLLRSGNDAAVALAEYVGDSVENFCTLMNKKAKELNLTSTHFVTPHGLDNEEHYTTAYELASLTDYALKNETFAKIVNTKTYTITLNNYPKTISNTNELLGNISGVYGVKTGFTNGANRCLVSACKRGDLDVICVVLGCDTKKNRTQDSIKLINYTFDNFSLVNIEQIIDDNFKEWYFLHTNSFTINKGLSQTLSLHLTKSELPYSYMAIKNSDLENINIDISFESYYEAPIYSNAIIGKLKFKINECEYFTINIRNYNSIPRKNISYYLMFMLKNYRNYFSC